MGRRTKRNFSERDREEFLKGMKDFREVCIRVSTNAPIGSEAYRLADKFITGIMEAGGQLTGDPNHFVMR